MAGTRKTVIHLLKYKRKEEEKKSREVSKNRRLRKTNTGTDAKQTATGQEC